MLSAKPKEICELGREEKVALIGEVYKNLENGFMLKDPTGKVQVISREIPKKKQVRVIGFFRNGKVYSNLIQDFEEFDRDLYFKAIKLLKKSKKCLSVS